MKGKHKVIVSTKRLKYEFELRRNLTIIQGDSATGKTTLVDMIRDFVNNPTGTPVEVICDKKCHVVEGSLWKEQLSGISDCIVFIDEGNEFITTVDFADKIQKTEQLEEKGVIDACNSMYTLLNHIQLGKVFYSYSD